MEKLRIGVLGAGHLGKIHIRILKDAQDYELIGFHDPNPRVSAEASAELGVQAFADMDSLLEKVEVVDIVTPTLSHYDCATRALRSFKHVFIEKPITNTLEEARTLVNTVHEAECKAQVGHVERFNPAFVAARPMLSQPMFIETHRLAQFNPRGTDVPVVLDLMIHDIDIVLHAVGSPVKDVQASGVSVISDTPDIANARIAFENGCVANLTASRISMKNMRKSRFFQRDAYISVDFLEKSCEVVRMEDIHGEPDPFALVIDPGNGKPEKRIHFEKPEILETNAIGEELKSLAGAIREDSEPIVTVEDGLSALEVAHMVMERIKQQRAGAMIGP